MLRWYFGKGGLSYQGFYIFYMPLVSQSMPHTWYKNKLWIPFYVTIYIWLLLSALLSMAYKSNLLANLVQVDLERQPHTLQVIKFNKE